MQTIKKVTEKSFPVGDEGQQFQRRVFFKPRDVSMSDLRKPEFWGPVAQDRRIQTWDVIRVISAEEGLCFDLVVTKVVKGGLIVELFPMIDPQIEEEWRAPQDVAVVPVDHNGLTAIRIEEHADPQGKNFRVLALGGGELSKHASSKEAEGAMHAYMESLRVRMPTAKEHAQMATEACAIEAARSAEREEKRQKMADLKSRGR